MFNLFTKSGFGVIVSMLVISACSVDTTPSATAPADDAPVYRSGDVIPGQFIIVFHESAVATKGETLQSMTHDGRIELVHQAAGRLADRIAINRNAVKATFGTAIKGVVMTLTDKQLAALRQDPGVRYIEQDRWVSLPPFEIIEGGDAGINGKGGKGGGTPNQPAEQTPWGITKVGGPETPSESIRAWIVDTGIQSNHPDLNVDASQGKTYVTGTTNTEDGNGHGTHVSGTIGALDNEIGVVGVAPGIKLIPMRVLNKNGSGQFSWSISAFDWIAGHASEGDVVNYSVGPGSRYTSLLLDDAVTSMADAGVRVCLAAGNSSDDASYYSPARVDYTNVYTIAAMNSSTAWASFSNYGSPVDWIEPGVSVLSTTKGSSYATYSGTSMATPHATGMLAVGAIISGGTVSSVPSATVDDWGKRD